MTGGDKEWRMGDEAKVERSKANRNELASEKRIAKKQFRVPELPNRDELHLMLNKHY